MLLIACPLPGIAGGEAVDPSTRIVDEDTRKAEYFREHYDKREVRIPMRDGVELFTAVYSPKDTSDEYPILIRRTPYSVAPYGPDAYPEYPWYLGPTQPMAEDGFVFVYQDVRGCFMSGGEFVNVRPPLTADRSLRDIDESTDTYDTIEWLLENTPNNNGRAGLWGISYPGYYAAVGMINAHPALRAVSPQAPIADWYFDDFHHHGAFFLADAFNFFAVFGRARAEPTTAWGASFDHGTPDGYQFFLELGPLKNVNIRHFHGEIPFWNDLVAHPDYDKFWQARNILPHLRNVAPAVMTVGGWFDAEDLYGPLKIYRAVERQNPAIFNVLVMGPWAHGAWEDEDGRRLGNIDFGSNTSADYQRKIEVPFFRYHLKDVGTLDLPEAYVFETGANRWRSFDQWPPARVMTRKLYLHDGGRLAFEPPRERDAGFDEYISDPARPVPYSEEITVDTTQEFMVDDQRFAARRPDVVAYRTDALDEAVTLAGPIRAELWVSTSGTASDWVVKLIDVFPNDAVPSSLEPTSRPLGGYQMLVRGEVIRGRFRNSYEHPEPFVPGQPTRVAFELQDVLHTFRKNHRIMVQVQSTWFPLVDRNPQKYVDNIFLADEGDFIRTTQRVYRSGEHTTHLRVGILPQDTERVLAERQKRTLNTGVSARALAIEMMKK